MLAQIADVTGDVVDFGAYYRSILRSQAAPPRLQLALPSL
jgi:hypothetical protein